MIEVEEIMDESETCVRRKKVSEKLKKYIIETIMPQFEKQYHKCKDQTRGLYYMFCNTTKQPGVFSFAICNDSPELRKEFADFLNKYFAQNTLFCTDPRSLSGRTAAQTEAEDDTHAPYISGYIRKQI